MATSPFDMFKQLQGLQSRVGEIQEKLKSVHVTGSAGGGMVTVQLDGHKNCLGVKIDPEAAGDAEMLQDMVQAAFSEAARKVDEEAQKKTAGMLGGMGLPPGLI